MTSEVINMSVQQWRTKARTGDLTVEEMKLAIAAIREERLRAGGVSAKSKEAAAPKAPRAKKVKPEDINSDDLLNDLMG